MRSSLNIKRKARYGLIFQKLESSFVSDVLIPYWYLSGFVTGTQSSPRKASFIASTMDVVKQCFADPKYLPDKGKVITAKVFILYEC